MRQAKVIQGKQLSYNNYLDADAAWRCISDLAELTQVAQKKVAACVIKHMVPCGACMANDSLRALETAWNNDETSSFGSIIALSQTVDETEALWIKNKFVEVIVAPHFTDEAISVLSQKKNLRLIELPLKKQSGEKMIRSISGGLLVQDEDELLDREWQSMTREFLPEKKIPLMKFGLIVTKYLKSNALCLVEERNSTLTILSSGVGQPNRVRCLKSLIADDVKDVGESRLKEAILISDAFFPDQSFYDNPNLAPTKV